MPSPPESSMPEWEAPFIIAVKTLQNDPTRYFQDLPDELKQIAKADDIIEAWQEAHPDELDSVKEAIQLILKVLPTLPCNSLASIKQRLR